MKLLIVCSGNNTGGITPFIKEQAESLFALGLNIDYFTITGKGLFGYISNFLKLKKKIIDFQPNIIHAHYGLSGLMACLQRKIPTVVTYHGSDINSLLPRVFSSIAIHLSARNIFVSKKLADKIYMKNPLIIPCGINLDLFKPINKTFAREKLGLDPTKIYVLFSSSFTNKVKNYSLAKSVIDELQDFPIELLELKGYSRSEVSLLLNAVDLAIMTSFKEGSPQFIKEAMACNTPIVSVEVGEVRDIINNASNCYVIEGYRSKEIADCIRKILITNQRSDGREYISEFELSIIAKKILSIYNSLHGS